MSESEGVPVDARSFFVDDDAAKTERVTLRVPKRQVQGVEALVERGQFPSKSEAIRAAVRQMLEEKWEEFL